MALTIEKLIKIKEKYNLDDDVKIYIDNLDGMEGNDIIGLSDNNFRTFHTIIICHNYDVSSLKLEVLYLKNENYTFKKLVLEE